MLKRSGIAAGLIAGTWVLAAAVPAGADDPEKDAGAQECGFYICVGASEQKSGGQHRPAHQPKKSKTGKKPKCVALGGQEMPCSDPDFGTFHQGCYIKPAKDQPPKSDPAWEGHTTGAVYNATCLNSHGGHGLHTGWVWLPEAPGGAGVDPAQLAQEALDKMALKGPDIGIRPKPDGKGVVGMPVWMWTQETATTYGPNTASASAGGTTVTATAKVEKITWEMGDGKKVVCNDAGTPYKPSYGKRESPDCGHVYRTTSKDKPGKRFAVEATSTWAVDWEGGGDSGQLDTTRTSQVQVTVGEVQVLN